MCTCSWCCRTNSIVSNAILLLYNTGWVEFFRENLSNCPFCTRTGILLLAYTRLEACVIDKCDFKSVELVNILDIQVVVLNRDFVISNTWWNIKNSTR